MPTIPSNLTPIQIRILKGLSEGKHPKLLAAELEISRPGVGNHLFQAYKVLGCHSAAHAVAIALRRGLIN